MLTNRIGVAHLHHLNIKYLKVIPVGLVLNKLGGNLELADLVKPFLLNSHPLINDPPIR